VERREIQKPDEIEIAPIPQAQSAQAAPKK